MNDQPEALRVARALEVKHSPGVARTIETDLAAARLLREQHAEIEELRAERDALRADAERLDYIKQFARCDPKMDGQHVWWPTSFNHRLIGPTLRAAIDAAMGGKP